MKIERGRSEMTQFSMDRCIRKYISNEDKAARMREFLETISAEEEVQRFAFYEMMSQHAVEGVRGDAERMKRTVRDAMDRRQILFHHEAFDDIRSCIHEQEEFLNRPVEVEDGVIQCRKCGSHKTFSYAKQTRASDEGTTVFVTCAKCHHQFRL